MAASHDAAAAAAAAVASGMRRYANISTVMVDVTHESRSFSSELGQSHDRRARALPVRPSQAIDRLYVCNWQCYSLLRGVTVPLYLRDASENDIATFVRMAATKPEIRRLVGSDTTILTRLEAALRAARQSTPTRSQYAFAAELGCDMLDLYEVISDPRFSTRPANFPLVSWWY